MFRRPNYYIKITIVAGTIGRLKSREAILIFKEMLKLRNIRGTMFNRTHIQKKALTIAVLLLCLLPKEGHLTQVGINYISLEDVIQRSEAVVEAVKTDSFIRQEKIIIHSDTVKYPPFIKIMYYYQVTGILYKQDSSLSIGKEISVENANSESNLRLHRMYYLEGIGKSPIHDRYRSDVDIDDVKKGKVILFLRKAEKNGSFKYTVDFAYERDSRKSKIVRMIGKIKN
jgi:hypothetical protein